MVFQLIANKCEDLVDGSRMLTADFSRRSLLKIARMPEMMLLARLAVLDDALQDFSHLVAVGIRLGKQQQADAPGEAAVQKGGT